MSNDAFLTDEAARFALPRVTLDQDVWQFLLAEYECARGHVERSIGADHNRRRMACYGAALRLIDACLESKVIRDELKRIAQERREAKVDAKATDGERAP